MLTILAYRTTWKELEIYEFEPVNLTYAFTDITQVNKPTSGYSQTFRVPLTPKNEDVFGPYTLAQVPAYDLKEKIPVRLMDGGVLIMQGYIQVKGWYITGGQFVDVEVAFFGETADLAKSVGEGLLSDLDLSAFNHSVSYSNVTGSWSGSLLSGDVRYGVVDRFRNWNESSNPGTSKMYPSEFTPFIRVEEVVKDIFDAAGFEYASTWLSGQSDLYMMLHGGGRNLRFTEDLDSMKFWVGRTSDLTLTAPTTFTDVTFQESSPFYDLGADFATATWTVPVTGYYTMSFFYTFTLATGGATLQMRLTDGTTHYTITTGNSGSLGGYQKLLSGNFTAGTTWKVQAQTSAGNVTFISNSSRVGAGGTSWHITSVLPWVSTLDTARNMPKMRQIDFLMGLQKCFNLVFIPDRVNPKKIYIEPFNDYMATGDKKDWTNKIDLGMDITVTPTSDLQKKRYVWTHSEGEDLVNVTFQNSTSRVYGQHEILDPANDFATGEEIITSGFAPFVTSLIPDTPLNILRLISAEAQDDASLPEVKARLAYWNGQLDTSILVDNSGTAVANDLPFFGQFDTNNTQDADVTTDSLMFGIELPFFDITANPYDTLYNKYWQLYANQLYSSDARILTATFRLEPYDLSTFEWSDKIYLFDTYWRVLEISGYDPTTEGTVTVKLLKILGTIRDCTYIPATGRTGRIEFTTSTGSGIFTVNRTCCERYGFIYDVTTAYCYQP
jgi:hypothetical protein